MKKASNVRKVMASAKRAAGNAGHTALAGATTAAMTVGALAGGLRDKVAYIGTDHNKKQVEVVTMKKSTLISLLVALAAVAGVLGALYVYVLRRERELDEYEQLLFSEDFNDDLPEEEDKA